ncbi:glucose 1-dehydrogenase [Sphingomonas sp. CL5.1]|uniref:SDR family NAD(P)-dependent oxidoreductase n=1 Tax=Sphingomonas sp. CL5.1 TaxID=2653203 RepID=UPI001581C601|nr:glucose 1-dehydrogenase [Sphingomonas sp. CL5.1]QKR99868.1 glucose 1-dehydrogenase [Sphingomonas sp. CL5.1]
MSVDSEIQYAPARLDLAGKVALVTGGTRGIGRGIVLAMAAAGAKVIVSGRDRSNAEDVVAATRKVGTEGDLVVCDLFDDDAVDTLISDTVALAGKLDILVNNAGIDADGPMIDYDLETWRRVIRFDLEVPMRLSQQAARHFVANGGGSIVNIASVLSQVAVAEAGAYTPAKHGVLGLTRTMALELGKQGVRVNCVAPGLIQTDMTNNLWGSEAGMAYARDRIPCGRIGQPRDIGGAVVFLASEAADFIHGQVIVVDGGSLAT